ncbi:hypothetical protein ElyMa_002272300 [Elysia marginata]|uniref:Uncharacterized protein n=1 Tax=Elysia marginata TaxID=1093978 RepID=A0AAV4FZM5_9GAST|nr:hypothetical protein ElyMa_002272300 [Elysia marginata]
MRRGWESNLRQPDHVRRANHSATLLLATHQMLGGHGGDGTSQKAFNRPTDCATVHPQMARGANKDHARRKTITYDVITPIGRVGFPVQHWLTGPIRLSAILDFLRYGLRPPKRARSA